MKVLIHAPMPVESELEKLIYEKAATFNTYISGITKVDFFLKTKVTRMRDAKISEIRISLPGNQVFADAHAKTFESAVILAAKRVKKQLVKRHELAVEKHVDLEEIRNK